MLPVHHMPELDDLRDFHLFSYRTFSTIQEVFVYLVRSDRYWVVPSTEGKGSPCSVPLPSCGNSHPDIYPLSLHFSACL